MALRFERHSLAGQVAEVLRREVVSGAWREWLPTERALCAQLGVSRRTLRSALRQLKDEELIVSQGSAGTRVKQGRRTPEKAARRDERTMGLLMPEEINVSRPYLMLWIDHLKSELFESGVTLRVHSGPQFFQRGGGAALRRLVEQHRHDCWILALSNRWVQRWFEAARVPVIVAGMLEADVHLPAIHPDIVAVARHATGQLLAAGHRRLAMFAPGIDTPGSQEIADAFRHAIEHGAHPGARGEVLRVGPTVGDHRRALDRLLRQRPAPTGMFVLNPLFGSMVLTDLMRRGLRVPGEVSLITTFGDPFMRYLSPEPSRYTYDPATYARKLARMTQQVLHHEELATRNVQLTPNFLKGETLGPAPGG